MKMSLLGWLLGGMGGEPEAPNTDLPNRVAQNQLWGQNVLASDMPYDEYSPFANPNQWYQGEQTMGQRNWSYPNPGVGMSMPPQLVSSQMGPMDQYMKWRFGIKPDQQQTTIPGQEAPSYQNDLIELLVRRYFQQMGVTK